MYSATCGLLLKVSQLFSSVLRWQRRSLKWALASCVFVGWQRDVSVRKKGGTWMLSKAKAGSERIAAKETGKNVRSLTLGYLRLCKEE